MTFLASLLAQIVEWLLSKGAAAITALISKLVKRKQIIDESQESVQPLKDATTGEQIDKATDSTLSGL